MTDEMKLAWQELNRRLEKQDAFITDHLLTTRLVKAKHSLRPLFVGQIAQILFGIAMVALGVATWAPNSDVPHVFVAGIVLHVYGVATIIFGGVLLGRMREIDYAAPVASIQKQLANLRVFYIRSGMAVGLPWWVLWVPFVMSLVAVLLGVDMYARMPLTLNLCILFGIAGLFATWLFYRWSRHPSRAALRERLDDGAAGGSLRNARRILDEIARFEKE